MRVPAHWRSRSSRSRAAAAFDDALQPVRLTDADTRSALHELLDAFAEWVQVIRTGEGDHYAALHAGLSSDEGRMPRASQATRLPH